MRYVITKLTMAVWSEQINGNTSLYVSETHKDARNSTKRWTTAALNYSTRSKQNIKIMWSIEFVALCVMDGTLDKQKNISIKV